MLGAVRPRRLALLAILAAAGTRGLSRDQVLAILWPESDLDRGRHALSQTLYSLRHDLGMEAVLAGAELRLDPARVSSDVSEFRAAIAAEDWQRASALYAGPFLDGFYLTDAAEFERWTEKERSHLARGGLRAIETTAAEAVREGRLDLAAESWRRLTRLDPLSSRFATRYMEALAGLGERAAAMAHGQEHAALVRQELETDPDQEVVRLLVRLRASGVAVPEVIAPAPALSRPASSSTQEIGSATSAFIDSPPDKAPLSHPDPEPVREEARVASPRSPSLFRWVAAAAVLVTAAIIAAMASRKSEPEAERAPVLAVGRIQDLVTPDSVQLGGVLSEMLATSLGRLTDLPVIANSRILELIPGGADTARAARTDAARRAGATQVLEGELIPLPDRRLLFELRRVDIERGIVRRGYQLSGADRMALFDSMTALIAADLHVTPPSGTLAEVSTRSPIAYRLYEEGLRAYYQFDGYAANRLFHAAIREDSTFAMATYYAWRSEVAINSTRQEALADRALALASRASERDRLLIMTHIGAGRLGSQALPVADSLATRYPNDPEALMRAAEVTHDLKRVVALLNRSIALDSAAGIQPNAVCRMCEAFHRLAERYDWADSVVAVEKTIRRWSSLRPADYAAWAQLAEFLVGIGRRADAENAMRRADSLGAPQRDPRELRLVWSLRSDDLPAANESCRTGLVEAFGRYRWMCTIALRMQGRHREAALLVRERRNPETGAVHRALPVDRVHSAILDMETGRPSVAADQLLRLAKEVESQRALPPGVAARSIAWNLTLSATAAASANDTARVSALIDSVETIGSRSLFGRDRLLHHFLRGLLLAKAQQHTAAIREFRTAIHSPTHGYTRINYELAKSLLAVNRAAEAIAILHSALRGGIEGSGLYLTRTETHELLARAFAASGQNDSAAVHYAIVERAWRDADPSFKSRHDAARKWLVAVGRSVR